MRSCAREAKADGTCQTLDKGRKNCNGKYLPDRIGTFAPCNTDTFSTLAGRNGTLRRGRWLCAQRTEDKTPETIRGRRREDTGGEGEADGGAGPGAQKSKLEGAEARQRRIGPKPQKECAGGARGEDDDGDGNPWRSALREKKNSEKDKRELCTRTYTYS